MATSKKPKLTKLGLKRRGQISWFHQLVKAGKADQAEAWAARHKLYAVPPNDPLATLSPKSTSSQPATDNSALPAHSTHQEAQADALPRSATPLTAAYSGGAGVSQAELGQNLDQSAPRGNFSQLRVGGLVEGLPTASVGIAADAALASSPSGEVEGEMRISQANLPISVSNRLENGGWVVSGEGVTGKACRNRFFVEVQVGGQWAKAAVGDRVVKLGQRVRVRLEWLSADGRDAEYEIVEVLPDLEEPRQAKPIGFANQNAREVPLEPVAVAQEPVTESPAEIEPVEDGSFMDRAREAAFRELMAIPGQNG